MSQLAPAFSRLRLKLEVSTQQLTLSPWLPSHSQELLGILLLAALLFSFFSLS